MLGDLYLQKQAIYGGFALSQFIATTDTTKTFTTPALKSTLYKLFVQRVRVIVLVGNAGKTIALADETTGTVLTPALALDTAGTVYTFDYGPAGRVLAVNERIKATISAAGASVTIDLEGYSRT